MSEFECAKAAPTSPRPKRREFDRLFRQAPEGGPTYCPFDGGQDGLGRVQAVKPALTAGPMVSTHRVADSIHLLVTGWTPLGEEVALLVCRSGWTRVSPSTMWLTDRDGRREFFEYRVGGPIGGRPLRLSWGDRKKISAALLNQFLGPWDGRG